jgi:hypothetical protein
MQVLISVFVVSVKLQVEPVRGAEVTATSQTQRRARAAG